MKSATTDVANLTKMRGVLEDELAAIADTDVTLTPDERKIFLPPLQPMPSTGSSSFVPFESREPYPAVKEAQR